MRNKKNRMQNVALLIRETLGQAPEQLFRYCQIGFWVFIALVSYTTLNLWFEQYQFTYFAHVIVQSIVGLFLSVFLQKSFLAMWYKSDRYRIWVGLALIFAIALIWTGVRMVLFNVLTGEQDIWWNFGGWYFSGIFIYLCWTAMFHGLMYYQLLQREHQILLDSQDQIEEEYEKRVKAQAIAKEAQLKMLRYQLSPHFLSNALNSVNALIEMEQGELAQQTVVNLSKFLRYLLDHDMESQVTVKQELNALMLYLNIEKVRFGERLEIELAVDEATEEGLIPSLLFQPIVENSIKHAISKSEDGGTIRISVQLEQDMLKIELSDSGKNVYIDINVDQLKKSRSIGISNTRARLEAIYPQQHKLHYELEEHGQFKTHIHIPFKLGKQFAA